MTKSVKVMLGILSHNNKKEKGKQLSLLKMLGVLSCNSYLEEELTEGHSVSR